MTTLSMPMIDKLCELWISVDGLGQMDAKEKGKLIDRRANC